MGVATSSKDLSYRATHGRLFGFHFMETSRSNRLAKHAFDGLSASYATYLRYKRVVCGIVGLVLDPEPSPA
jgi:hypothetical protein